MIQNTTKTIHPFGVSVLFDKTRRGELCGAGVRGEGGGVALFEGRCLFQILADGKNAYSKGRL